MTWRLLDRPKTSKVTKALAMSFAKMDAAPHDRPLSERRLMVYQNLLAQGQFRPVTWASAICKETGDVYRVNGKHTSIMLSGLDKMPEFFVTVEEYECDTLEDVAQLYATFDSKMQSRSAKDIYLSFAAVVPELANISNKIVSLSVSGMAYHVWQGMATAKQPAERAELLLEEPGFVIWLGELLSEGLREDNRQSSDHIRRSPVVSAIYASWKKAKGPALEFWTAVRDEIDPDPNSASRKLARFLHRAGTVARAGTTGSRGVMRAGGREFYVKSLHAWNAWRKNESTNLNYHADAKIPAAV
jgi:hypothetical protein